MNKTVLPRPGAQVLQPDGSFHRIWYKALEAAIGGLNGLVSGATIYTDTGTQDALEINSGISAYTAGLVRYVVPAFTNSTTNVTLSDSGLTPQIITFPDGSFPAAGQIVAGVTIEVVYSGVRWELQNLQPSTQAIVGDLSVGGNLSVTGSIAGGAISGTTIAGTDITGTSLDVTTTVKTGAYTVATLPAGSQGMRAFVTDATVTTFASVVAGTGANKVPVVFDGVNWIIG